jgi:branched-chain amino acid transport system substrate-binding protein
MKKWIYVLVAVFLLGLALPLAGCVEDDTIKVGAVLDVTGPNSPLGLPEKLTLEMMEKQINEDGGINGKDIEIIIYDTAGDETECVTLVTKLIEQDNVVAIIGPSSTGESLAVVNTVDQAEVPLISLAADERITLPVGDSEWVFKTPQTTFMAVQEVYSYIEAQNITKIAIMTDTKGFGAGGKQDLIDEASNYGLTIVSQQSYDNTDPDMGQYIPGIEGSGAEAVVCWGTNPGPANIAMALQGTGIPFFGSHGIANTSFITLAGDASEGVIFPSGKLVVADQLPESDLQKDVLLQFIDDYESEYSDQKCNTFAGHAYDALSMLKIALEDAGDADRDKVRDGLEEIENFAGTGGIFSMSAEDHCGLSEGCMVIVKIEDGAWVLEA